MHLHGKSAAHHSTTDLVLDRKLGGDSTFHETMGHYLVTVLDGDYATRRLVRDRAAGVGTWGAERFSHGGREIALGRHAMAPRARGRRRSVKSTAQGQRGKRKQKYLGRCPAN